MPKHIITLIVLLFCLTDCYSQTLTISDLLNIAKLSHKQANQFLTADKHFTALPPISVYDKTISQFKKSLGGVNEFVIKSEWEDNRRTIASAHYDIAPKSVVGNIVKQLQVLNFKLITKEDDAHKHFRLYDNGSFTLSIYTFEGKKLPASIEVHEK